MENIKFFGYFLSNIIGVSFTICEKFLLTLFAAKMFRKCIFWLEKCSYLFYKSITMEEGRVDFGRQLAVCTS